MCISKKSFTIIELLIDVAIISILAAIAVPNFLEAQTRAKVSRVKADMRTMLNGLEAYAVDHNKYPKRHYGAADPEQNTDHFVPDLDTKMEDLSRLTTPIAYLTSIPVDIFERSVPAPLNKIDYYDPIQTYRYVNYLYSEKKRPGYMLISVGPDGHIGVLSSGAPGGYPPQPPGGRDRYQTADPLLFRRRPPGWCTMYPRCQRNPPCPLAYPGCKKGGGLS